LQNRLSIDCAFIGCTLSKEAIWFCNSGAIKDGP